jgi:hypothetical protein
VPLIRTGDRAGAVAAGAIVGGALGVIVGSQVGRAAAPPPVVYAPPPPPEEVVEEEVAEPAPMRRRAARRVVEVEEDGPEVEPQDCVTRRSKSFDPATGRTVFTKERDCR